MTPLRFFRIGVRIRIRFFRRWLGLGHYTIAIVRIDRIARGVDDAGAARNAL
jgi:hypothetical protein